MPYLIEKQQVDFEGFPIGRPGFFVGPFDTQEQAAKWLDEHPKYTRLCPQYDPDPRGRYVIGIVDPFQWVSSPDDPRWN